MSTYFMNHTTPQGNGAELLPMEGKEVPSWRGNTNSQKKIDEPTNLDILCGKDQLSTCHPGNRCFRAMVGYSVEEYEALSDMRERDKFFFEIVKSIRISGGRFLRRQSYDTGWEQVDRKVIKQKVRQAFRDVVMRRRKRPKRLKEGSSPGIMTIKPYYRSAGHFDWKGIVSHKLDAESAERANPHNEICEPRDLDILHGRDDFSLYHVGNTCFRALIGCCVPHYVILRAQPDKSKKSEFFEAIANAIQNSGGRFLRRRLRGGGWEQDDARKARETVGQSLRFAVRTPEKMVRGSSLIDLAGLFGYYKSAYDFDWKGIVETAQRLPS
jgi:hypothetical protein